MLYRITKAGIAMGLGVSGLFPSLSRFRAYLDTASVGLVPKNTVDFLSSAAVRISSEPSLVEFFGELSASARSELAKLVGADRSEIAFTVQTTECLKKALMMLRPSSGARVVSIDLEFPTVSSVAVSACEEVGCEVAVSECGGMCSEEDLAKSLRKGSGRGGVVLVSSVNWITGWRLDLRELAEKVHEQGAYLVVDGVQHVGALSLDVKREEVDVLCAGGEKWLLTPYFGIGFMYVRRELMEQLELPPYGIRNREEPARGWGNYWQDPEKDPWSLPSVAKNASKYEWGGGVPYLSIAALGEGAKLINSLGIESVESHIKQLRGDLVNKLLEAGFKVYGADEGAERHSGIVLAQTDLSASDEIGVVRQLREKGVAVSYRGARGVRGVRVSPHLYNTGVDISVFIEELAQATRKLSR